MAGPATRPENYVGLDNDSFGGMTNIGKTIRDAWVFGILPETQTCEGWSMSRINGLLQQVNDEWDKYGCLVSGLPADLFERHQRIHSKAIEIAKSKGWNGEHETSIDL